MQDRIRPTIDRRTFLRSSLLALGVAGAGSLLAACAPTDAPAPTAAPKPTTAAAPPTGTVAPAAQPTAAAKPAATQAAPAQASTGKLQPVRFLLNFTPLGRVSPFYYAFDTGMYAKAGLDVSILTSSGAGPAFQQMVAGQADWMINDLSQMMSLLEKTPKPHMRSYAVLFAKASQTIFFFEGGPIKTPKDLEGKTIATSAGSNEYLLFPLFAKANNVDPNKVNWQVVDATAKTGLLLQGKTEATSTTIFGLPGLNSGKKPDQKIGYFEYGDYGVNSYGASLITTDDFAKAHPEAIKPFVQTSMQAFKEAFQNPQPAVDSMAKMVPGLDKAVAMEEMKLLPDVMIGPAQKEHGYGWQDPAMVKSTYDQVTQLFNVQPSQPPDQYFTNDALA